MLRNGSHGPGKYTKNISQPVVQSLLYCFYFEPALTGQTPVSFNDNNRGGYAMTDGVDQAAIQAALNELERRVKDRSFPKSLKEKVAKEISTQGLPAITKWFHGIPPEGSSRSVLTKTTERIAVEINEAEFEDALEQGRIGYMARAVVLATMPHSKPAGLEFKRKSGDYTLLMSVPNELHKETGIALPYGSMPRLIFLWLTTEIKQTRERLVYLGKTRSEFMRRLGLNPTTGKRGNMRTFEQQTKNLLGTLFSAWRKTGQGDSGGLQLHHRLVASDMNMWWDHDVDEFDATINIDAEFYKELLQGGIPVDLNVAAKLKNNSLALDLYTFLTYRFSTLTRKLDYPWEWTFEQFGSEWQDTPEGHKEFRKYFKTVLKRVLEEYPEANVRIVRSGLQLLPSPPHIKRIKQ
jgi:hypothetical protein